jgi:hypothetical protein
MQSERMGRALPGVPCTHDHLITGQIAETPFGRERLFTLSPLHQCEFGCPKSGPVQLVVSRIICHCGRAWSSDVIIKIRPLECHNSGRTLT